MSPLLGQAGTLPWTGFSCGEKGKGPWIWVNTLLPIVQKKQAAQRGPVMPSYRAIRCQSQVQIQIYLAPEMGS